MQINKIHSVKLDENPLGVEEIELYSFYINQFVEKKKKEIITNKKITRKYIFEIHKFDGFAMIKFYPRCKVKDDKKYMMRGVEDLGFNLSKDNFRLLINCAIKLMKDYLDAHKNNYIGYIGQPDARDDRSPNKSTRLVSQRRRIYHLIRYNEFTFPNYEVTSNDFYSEINLRLIRKIVTRNPSKRSKKQKSNFDKFTEIFNKNIQSSVQFMTNTQLKEYS